MTSHQAVTVACEARGLFFSSRCGSGRLPLRWDQPPGIFLGSLASGEHVAIVTCTHRRVGVPAPSPAQASPSLRSPAREVSSSPLCLWLPGQLLTRVHGVLAEEAHPHRARVSLHTPLTPLDLAGHGRALHGARIGAYLTRLRWNRCEQRELQSVPHTCSIPNPSSPLPAPATCTSPARW